MNTDYIQSEIDKFQQLIADDEKKKALIDQNISYYKRQLKNAERFLKELESKKDQDAGS